MDISCEPQFFSFMSGLRQQNEMSYSKIGAIRILTGIELNNMSEFSLTIYI